MLSEIPNPCRMVFNLQKQAAVGKQREGAFIPKVTVCQLERENRLAQILELEPIVGLVPQINA